MFNSAECKKPFICNKVPSGRVSNAVPSVRASIAESSQWARES